MYNQNLTNVGINTLSYSLPEAGPANVRGKLTLPQLYDDGSQGQSAVVVTVKQNGTTIYTGLPGAEGFRVDFLGAAGDAMQVIFASAAAIDQDINVVKASVGFSSGQ